MRSEEFDEFAKVMDDLCAALDRPITDARKRVFWDVLKPYHLHDIRRSVLKWRNTQRKMPAPVDLKPERATAPPKPVDDSPSMSRWAVAANRILFHVAFRDPRRGFKPIGVWGRMPPEGWGLPLRLPDAIDVSRLNRALEIKRDYVQMAENAELSGEPMDGEEYQAMCKEGFERLLGTIA